MKVGNLDLGPRPVLLAPMEDVTDVSFRILCREQGADMVYTEFIPSDGRSKKRLRWASRYMGISRNRW